MTYENKSSRYIICYCELCLQKRHDSDLFLKCTLIFLTKVKLQLSYTLLHVFHRFSWTYGLMGSSSYTFQIEEAPLPWIAFVSLRSFPKSGNCRFKSILYPFFFICWIKWFVHLKHLRQLFLKHWNDKLRPVLWWTAPFTQDFESRL